MSITPFFTSHFQFYRISENFTKLRIFIKIFIVSERSLEKNGDLLNSTWVKYLAFETTEECREWSNLLDKLIVQRKNQIQIKRSVSVALHGGSGFPNKVNFMLQFSQVVTVNWWYSSNTQITLHSLSHLLRVIVTFKNVERSSQWFSGVDFFRRQNSSTKVNFCVCFVHKSLRGSDQLVVHLSFAKNGWAKRSKMREAKLRVKIF